MNAPARIARDAAQTQSWHQSPAARALIDSLRANPPKLVERVQHFPISDDHWTEFAPDSRITKLRTIWNDAFLAAEREGGEAAAVAFLALPNVDDILADIGPHQKLFLGMIVPPVPLSSFADASGQKAHPLQNRRVA